MTFPLYAGLFSHLVAAIVCAAAGLIIWDVGTRPPARVVTGIAEGIRRRHSLTAGIVRFIAGAVFLVVSAALVYYAVPLSAFEWYTAFEIIALLSGLTVELLIGDDVRVLLGLRRGTGAP